MLERRTVIDVKKIRERLEKGAEAEAAEKEEEKEKRKREEERKDRETKAEELMRAAMRREEERRHARSSQRSARAAQQQQQQQPEEESKEQISVQPPPASASLQDPETFITSTHDLQRGSQQPALSSLPSRAFVSSRSDDGGDDGDESVESGSVQLEPEDASLSRDKDDSDDEELDAYTAFINDRVRHMLVSNSVFIPVNGCLLVNTPHTAALSSAASSPPPQPQFQLPSLQPLSQSAFLPSSASVSLASSDERQLYTLLLFLSRIPLLSSLPLRRFFRLSREVKEMRFDEYEVIANEGEEGAALYLIKEGRIDTKLNLERSGRDAAASTAAASASPAGEPAFGPSPLRRRFHSINTASLDVSCLSSHDVCGEVCLFPPHAHLTSLISMTPSVCYSVPLASLSAHLPAASLQSLRLYASYSLHLTRTYCAVRERYRSSYHTSVVDFRLFVEGSLRRNLRHKNERGRMRKEIEQWGGGAGGGGGWGRDRDASRQIRHTQRTERAAGSTPAAPLTSRRSRAAAALAAAAEERQRAEDQHHSASVQFRETRRMNRLHSLPPVLLSFTSLNISDSSPVHSTDSSPISSVQSRIAAAASAAAQTSEPTAGIAMLEGIHPALR